MRALVARSLPVRGRDSAESEPSRRCDGPRQEPSVHDDVGRLDWQRIVVVAGYGLGVLLIVWGAATGELVPVLFGLVILAILFLTTNG